MLLQKPHRFNELLTSIPGLSDRLLTERLRELEDNGLVERHVIPDSPVRVEDGAWRRIEFYPASDVSTRRR